MRYINRLFRKTLEIFVAPPCRWILFYKYINNKSGDRKMYAIIATSGRQFRVNKNDIIDVDLMGGKEGEKVTFSEVLVAGEGKDLKFGSPLLKGATVTGEIIKHYRGPKLIAFKMKRRKGYRKTKGHRSELTKVKIISIEA